MRRKQWAPESIDALDYLAPHSPVGFAHFLRVTIDAAIGAPASDPVAVSADDWRLYRPLVMHHRIEGFVQHAKVDGAVALPDSAVVELEERSRQIVFRSLRLRAAAEELGELLAAHAIDVRVLKGLATGLLDWNRPAIRRTMDVDVLVRPSQFDAACDAILTTRVRELKPDLPAHLIVERTFRRADKVALDVHHRLFRFGLDDGDSLFDDPELLPGGRLSALPAPARLVHAAGHLLLSPPGHRQMSSLFDVAVLADRVDIDAALRVAERFGVADVVRVAIWLSRSVGSVERVPYPKVEATLINKAHLRSTRRVDLELRAIVNDAPSRRGQVALVRHQVRQGVRRSRRPRRPAEPAP